VNRERQRKGGREGGERERGKGEENWDPSFVCQNLQRSEKYMQKYEKYMQKV
jgi:hypothetical protein